LASQHLHNDRLPDCIVNLSFILIENSIRFIWQLRFVVPCLRDNYWPFVLLFYLLLLRRLAVIVKPFADHNPPRVTSIGKRKLVLVLMNRNYCAATQAYVKASLEFKLALAIQKRGLKRLPRNVDSSNAFPFRFVLIVT
jgi:hypothetical protein